MVLTANDNTEPADDVPPAVVAQLVAYDEAKATEVGMHGDTSRAAEFSAELAPELACVDLLHRVWPTARTNALAHSDQRLPETLGDLRLVRELGRGGMGIVYEAEQTSLGRRVAVKVLPFAAVADAKSLQRFRNEVRAAAALDHPHIVKVYSVGEDRGQHFYTMQLIRGPTLADVIAELRTMKSAADVSPQDGSGASPKQSATSVAGVYDTAEFYRTMAQWGAEACGALQHAHDVGILHRDIKPSNLMLDEVGQLYVTDFGLARVGEEAGLTMTGDIVGTLRYMAPEQALGKRVVIDQRADIYALGATLYELLTLEPVFGEADRTILLNQIAFHEPVPPRKLDRRIPVDLETIVLKAMAKQPAERYQTSESMANDLRAFLEHRPIVAQPASLTERVRGWSRRHVALVRAAAVSLVLLTVLLAISTVWVKRAETRVARALVETSELLYTSDMALAYQAYDGGRPDEARTILDRYIPTESAADRRGLEWHLLAANLLPPESVTLVGHTGRVNEVAVFPDRRQVASVGDDGTLRIWHVADGKLRRTFSLSSEGLHSVAVSPDGRFVAAGNTLVYLCDLSGEGRTAEIFRHENTVESLAFHPNGQQLAAGARYHEVCLLTLDGQVVNRIPCESRVESLEFVEDGSLLIIPDRRVRGNKTPEGIVRLWSADLSNLQRELGYSATGRIGQITVARPSPTGRFIAVGELYQSRASILDAATGGTLEKTPGSRDLLTDLVYSPNGSTVAIGYVNGQVECFDLHKESDGMPMIHHRPLIFSAHNGGVSSLRFVDDQTVVTGGGDGMVRIWTRPLNPTRGYDVIGERVAGVNLSPDGQRLLCTYSRGYVIADSSGGKVLAQHRNRNEFCHGPVWSPTGDQAAVCCAKTGTVLILEPSGRQVCSIPFGDRPEAVAFSPDGLLIAVVGGQKLQVCRAGNGQEVFHRELAGAGVGVAFSRNGSLLAYCGQLDGIAIFDVATWRTQRELPCPSGAKCVAFSPDERLLATGHNDTLIRLWNVTTGQLLTELAGHERHIRNLAFSPSGHTLLSSAADGAVRVWSVNHRRAYGVFYRRLDNGVEDIWSDLGVSSDCRTLAIGHAADAQASPDVYVWHLSQDEPNAVTSK